MEINGEAKILRIFISNTDKFKHTPLYEVVVFAAKKHGLAGATVLKGIMSYGSSSIINSMNFWEITEKLPIVIEIVDESDKIDSFLETIKPYFDKIQNGFLVTTEKVNVVHYKYGKKKE